MSMTSEEKIIEKVRKALLAEATIAGAVEQRVYASHITSISEPKYPAISIFPLRSKPYFFGPEYLMVSLQIDIWYMASDGALADLLAIVRKVRDALFRQNLTDSTIGIKVAESIEMGAGPLMYEQDTGLWHYPMEYQFVVA